MADVVLRCNASTDTEESSNLKIEWLKNGQKIDYVGEASVSKNVQDNSLRISPAQVSDTAKYTCNASNGLDSHSIDVQFTVRGDCRLFYEMAHCLS